MIPTDAGAGAIHDEGSEPMKDIDEPMELLRVTFSITGDAVIATDTRGRVTLLTAVAESLTGWTAPDAEGLPIESILRFNDEGTREPVNRPVMELTASGLAQRPTGHMVLIAKDGMERPIDVSAAPIRDKSGDLVGSVVVLRDVSKRSQPAGRLEETPLDSESLLATVREPLVILDGDLRINSASRSFYQAFRVSPEETEGRLFFDLGNGQWDIPQLRTLLVEVLLKDSSFDGFDVIHDFPAIGMRTMLLGARKLHWKGGRPERILLAIEDITERGRTARALAASEVRFRRLFEAAKDGILILEADTGAIIDANPYLLDLLGYSHDELLGKELWELGVLGDIEASRAAFRELQEKGYVRYENLPLQTRSGKIAQAEFVSNVYWVDGRLIIQCNIRDITERLRSEERLKEADRRKDEFLAMLAHELRNPLAPIANAVEVMRLLELDHPDLLWVQEVVDRQLRQMTRLVDDLLDVSRITSGKITLRKELVELTSIVATAIENCRHQTDAREQELMVSIPAGPILLEADPARLEQLIANLLNNAAKYTQPRGKIWLSVEGRGDQVEVRVRDTGIGLAPEMLPRIFDLFAQADQSLARSQGGLGLGLTLVRRIVELHGGTVQAFSLGLGQGSELTVRLPVSKVCPSENPMPAPVATPVARTGLRVLVVDDNVDTLRGMTKLLHRSGYEVKVAHDGQTAIEAARAFQPEVVVLDIGLPGMDGYQVARKLRQEEDLKGALIIANSGYGQESDRIRSREAGFDYHLVKPIDYSALLELLASSPPFSSAQ
jgi:PAS domain S-box-containing protein